jgi:hypothetical protein
MAEEIPIAVNELSSGALFYQRMLYKLTAYPKDMALPVDMWYDKNLYGKINRIQDALVIDPKRLQIIKSADEETMVLDFVVDAFRDFRKFYLKKASSGQLSNVTNIKIKPKKGWVDPQILYHNHMKRVYGGAEEFVFRRKQQEISSIATFLPIFMKMVEEVCVRTPITLTSFITSKYCTPLVSGLIIELDEKSHSEDQDKFETWLKDPNYEFYVNAARLYGFMVDKNAPWRLVADIFSSTMQNYMSRYGTTKDNLFNRCYYPTHLSDILKIRSYAYQFYAAFTNVSPILTIPTVENGITVTNNTRRAILPIEDYFDKYDINFWVGVYCRVRAQEMELNWDETTLGHVAKRARKIHKYVDFYSAMDYINDKTKVHYYPDSFLNQQPEVER